MVVKDTKKDTVPIKEEVVKEDQQPSPSEVDEFTISATSNIFVNL
jgi:hypothetical protein